MRFYLIFFILFLTVQTNLLGVALLPLPLERQLKDADAVVHGVFLDESYKRISNENEDVVTEISLKVERSAGLKPSDLVNKNSFKVILPGGVWQGSVYSYPGTPKFTKGEEVVLIVKKDKYGFTLSEMALSKYLVKTKMGKVYLQSDAFPDHSKLGHVALDEFDDLVSFYMGSSLIQIGADLSVSRIADNSTASSMQNNFRDPASKVKIEEEEFRESRISLFWLVVIFSVLGLFSIISQRTKD